MFYYLCHGLEILSEVYYRKEKLFPAKKRYCSHCDAYDRYLGEFENDIDFKNSYPNYLSIEEHTALLLEQEKQRQKRQI